MWRGDGTDRWGEEIKRRFQKAERGEQEERGARRARKGSNTKRGRVVQKTKTEMGLVTATVGAAGLALSPGPLCGHPQEAGPF